MRKDKEKAIELRKDGRSYREIGELLKIPRSTLSGWFQGEAWSESVRDVILESMKEERSIHIKNLNSIRGERLRSAYAAAREEARAEFEFHKYHPLFISGIMLYWGGGVKHPKQGVRFSSSNPKMVRLYVEFLTKACRIPIESITAYVLIYPDIEERTSRAYWSKVSTLPWENFSKSTVLTGRKARKLGWGVCTVSIGSTYLKTKILEWINLLPEELLRREYYENMELRAGMVQW